MANEENLKRGKATQFRSGEEAARTGQKGGKNSGETRRRKKAMRQAAAMLLNTPVPANRQTKPMAVIKELLDVFGHSGEGVTYQDILLTGIMLKAMKGDVRAAEFIRDTAGESPALQIRDEELQLHKEEFQLHREEQNCKREQLAGAEASGAENNLLQAILEAVEINTDDLSEVQ